MNEKSAAEGRQLRFQPFLPPVTLDYLFKPPEPLLPYQQLGIIIPTEGGARELENMKQCVQVEHVAALFSVTIGYYLMDLYTPSLIS